MHERLDKEEGYGKSPIRREVGLELEERRTRKKRRREVQLEVSFKVKDQVMD